MDKKPPTIKNHNAEDEAAIQRALTNDNDSWEAPKLAKVLRRGGVRSFFNMLFIKG